MSEYGQIISPYRVAPAQGGLDDLALFLQRREMTDQSQVQSALAQATRAYLAQQQGLPQGVDPNAVQQFGIAGDTNTRAQNQDTRAGAQEGRQAQLFQEQGDFANRFNGALPEQSDPYLRALQLGGGRYGAEGLSGVLGGQFSRQGELAARGQMNDADNVAAQKRLEFELQEKAKYAADEQTRLDGVNQRQQGEAFDAFTAFKQTGDPAHLAKIDPRLLTSPVIADLIDQYKTEAKTRADAAEIDAAHKENPPPSPVGEIHERTKNKNLPPIVPNQFFDPRVMTPRREGDDALQMQYDNVKNMLGFIPKTLYHGGKDAGYKGAELIDQWFKNFRF